MKILFFLLALGYFISSLVVLGTFMGTFYIYWGMSGQVPWYVTLLVILAGVQVIGSIAALCFQKWAKRLIAITWGMIAAVTLMTGLFRIYEGAVLFSVVAGLVQPVLILLGWVPEIIERARRSA